MDLLPLDISSVSWFRHYGYKAWFWRPQRPALTTAPRDLRKQGWQRIEHEQLPLLDCLLGQLADVRQRETGGEPEFWVQAEELAFAQRFQAGVGFLLEPAFEQLLPSSLHVPEATTLFPPPSLGQVGAILVGHQYRERFAASLPEDAKAHLQQLEMALRTLHHDPGEPLSEYLLICSVPPVLKIYQDRLHTEHQALLAQLPMGERLKGWLATRHLTPGHITTPLELQKIEQKLALVREAARHLDTLRQPSEQAAAEYDQLWPEVRRHVQALVMAYVRLEHPLSLSTPIAARPEPGVDLTPDIWLKRNVRRVPILADPISRALIKGLRDGKAFAWDAMRQCASVQLVLQPPSGKAELELSLVPDAANPLTQVEAWRKLLKDHLVDTWLALQALILALTPDDLTASIPLTPNHLLAVCLREKSNYAYTSEQLKLTGEELNVLAHLHLRLTMHLPHRPPATPIVSPLVTLHQNEIALGSWVTSVPAQWRKTVTMTRRLLKVHPDIELRAKRLGLELTFQLAGYPQGAEFEMEDLHKLAGIYLETANPKRPRDGMMRAMKLLVGLPVLEPSKKQGNIDEPFVLDSRKHHSTLVPEDQIIGAFWALGNEAQREQVEQKHWGWFPAWRTLHWQFLPAQEPARMSPEQQ